MSQNERLMARHAADLSRWVLEPIRSKTIVFNDLVRGNIKFSLLELDPPTKKMSFRRELVELIEESADAKLLYEDAKRHHYSRMIALFEGFHRDLLNALSPLLQFAQKFSDELHKKLGLLSREENRREFLRYSYVAQAVAYQLLDASNYDWSSLEVRGGEVSIESYSYLGPHLASTVLKVKPELAPETFKKFKGMVLAKLSDETDAKRLRRLIKNLKALQPKFSKLELEVTLALRTRKILEPCGLFGALPSNGQIQKDDSKSIKRSGKRYLLMLESLMSMKIDGEKLPLRFTASEAAVLRYLFDEVKRGILDFDSPTIIENSNRKSAERVRDVFDSNFKNFKRIFSFKDRRWKFRDDLELDPNYRSKISR